MLSQLLKHSDSECLFLAHLSNVKTKKHTIKPEKENSNKTIYVQTSEVESRTQGSRPRSRTQKKSEAKAKDSLSEDRHSRGQGPRTQAQVLSKKEKKRSSQKFFRRSPKTKKVLTKFFKRSPRKNVFQKTFQALHKILTIQKILLSSSRGQANFRGLEASRPKPRT